MTRAQLWRVTFLNPAQREIENCWCHWLSLCISLLRLCHPNKPIHMTPHYPCGHVTFSTKLHSRGLWITKCHFCYKIVYWCHKISQYGILYQRIELMVQNCIFCHKIPFFITKWNFNKMVICVANCNFVAQDGMSYHKMVSCATGPYVLYLLNRVPIIMFC